MSKLNNFPILVALLSLVVAASMLPSPAAAAADERENVAPSPDEEQIKVTVPPEPEPGFYHYLEECSKKLSRNCGEKIVKSIFLDAPTTAKCCMQLVSLGKACHDDMVKFYVSLPELRLDGSKVFPKADKVWYQCVKTASSPSPSFRLRI